MATTVSPRPRRRSRIAAGRGAVAGGAFAAANLLARLIGLVAALVALVIVIGIALVVLKANPANSLVSWFHDTAQFLAGPFDGLFKPKDHRLAIGIDWGLAALVYLIVGRFIAGLLRR